MDTQKLNELEGCDVRKKHKVALFGFTDEKIEVLRGKLIDYWRTGKTLPQMAKDLNVSASSLHLFITHKVKPGAKVLTRLEDGFKSLSL